MYCPRCGREVDDNASFCSYCGEDLRRATSQQTNSQKTTENEITNDGVSKVGVGVLLALFLGIIGLIIGVCLYPSGTVERQTFMRGWGIGFAIEFGLTFILSLIYMI